MANNNYKIANFDPLDAMRRIYGYKGDWETANKDAQTAVGAYNAKGAAQSLRRRNDAAQGAQPYYAALRQNGYGDIADKLTEADYTGAGYLMDYYKALGKTPVREYARNRLKSYGLSDADADNLITWNDKTGEVGIGGINLGRPDVVSSDGVSYMSDINALNNAVDTYAKNTGIARPADLKWNETYDVAFGNKNAMSDEVRDSAKLSNEALRKSMSANDIYFNESQTPTARSADYRQTWSDVMPAYQYDADKAGRNAAASAAGSNGGNIDSFAAANARRQREASYANGARLAAELGIGARQATMGNMNQGVQNYFTGSRLGAQNARDLADAGVTDTQGYINLMTESRNERDDAAARDAMQAQADSLRAESEYRQAMKNYLYGQMLGQNTAETMARLYPGYMNPDGTFKDNITDTDIEAMLEEFKAKNPNYEKDPNLKAFYDSAVAFRNLKGLNVPGHLGYLSEGDVGVSKFAPYGEEDKNRALSKYGIDKNFDIQKMGIDSTERMQNARNQLEQTLAQMGYSHDAAQREADRMLDKYKSDLAANTEIKTTQIAAGATGAGTTGAGALDDSKVKAWIKNINNDLGKGTVAETEPGKYEIKNQKYSVIGKIMDSTTLTNEQKIYMLNVLGLTDEDIAASNNIHSRDLNK